jgi:transposase
VLPARRSRRLGERDQTELLDDKEGPGRAGRVPYRRRSGHCRHGGDRVYWKAPYYSLEGLFEELWLCNAQHVKNVPGRKSDLSDAEWLADVAAHGMVRPSFVPPPEIRELRELTRYRKTQVDARGKEIQRLEKVLQDAGLKLTSVASSVWSVSSRTIIEALIAGQRDPVVLAEMAKSRLRSKIPQLQEALSGHFGSHHAIVCRQIIDHIDFLDRSIGALTEEITTRLVPFEAAVAIVTSVPGISVTTAAVIVAETGADMSRFPTPEQLCAWAGVAPASYESAGKRQAAGTRHGAQWLRRALIEAARAASRTKRTYYNAQYGRIARRRGPNKAAPWPWPTPCCSPSGTCSPTVPSTKTSVLITSSAVTIRPLRRSGSHGGSRHSVSTSTSHKGRHNPQILQTTCDFAHKPLVRARPRSAQGRALHSRSGLSCLV